MAIINILKNKRTEPYSMLINKIANLVRKKYDNFNFCIFLVSAVIKDDNLILLYVDGIYNKLYRNDIYFSIIKIKIDEYLREFIDKFFIKIEINYIKFSDLDVLSDISHYAYIKAQKKLSIYDMTSDEPMSDEITEENLIENKINENLIGMHLVSINTFISLNKKFDCCTSMRANLNNIIKNDELLHNELFINCLFNKKDLIYLYETIKNPICMEKRSDEIPVWFFRFKNTESIDEKSFFLTTNGCVLNEYIINEIDANGKLVKSKIKFNNFQYDEILDGYINLKLLEDNFKKSFIGFYKDSILGLVAQFSYDFVYLSLTKSNIVRTMHLIDIFIETALKLKLISDSEYLKYLLDKSIDNIPESLFTKNLCDNYYDYEPKTFMYY